MLHISRLFNHKNMDLVGGVRAIVRRTDTPVGTQVQPKQSGMEEMLFVLVRVVFVRSPIYVGLGLQ